MLEGNVISVLSRGNQEMFHSAMLAWLLNEAGSHGLGRSFRDRVLSQLPFGGKYVGSDLEVLTEHKGAYGRYDIVLRMRDHGGEVAILENKTKALGDSSQGERYASGGADVALLGLLPEMFDRGSRDAWPLLSYRQIHGILQEVSLDSNDGFQFVVAQYRDYLDKALQPFEVLGHVAAGSLPMSEAALRQLADALDGHDYGDNDWRTLSYFYFVILREYLLREAPDLILGTYGKDEAKERQGNMLWRAEKNLQGPPFFEAVLFAPDSLPAPWQLREDIAGYILGADGEPLIPRLQLGGLGKLKSSGVHLHDELGKWALGVSGGVPQALWAFMQSNERYSSRLNGFKRRNFHFVPVTFADLPFGLMAYRLRELLGFAYDRNSWQQ